MDWILQLQGMERLDGWKKSKHHAFLKRLTSALRTPIQSKWRDGKTLHASGNQKRAGIALIIAEEIDFKPIMITQDKEGHCIM